MGIEICSIGGFTKTEGNSVAVKVDDEVVLLDMGLSMFDYVRFTEDMEDTSTKTYSTLLKANAVPDYGHIDDWKTKVVAIVPSHGHLDHVGAIPYAAPLFPPSAVVLGTPYTIEVLKSILWDEHLEIPHKFVVLNAGSSYKVSKKITIEFVHVTHSIPQTAVVVIHTPYGKVMYANDFKLDNTPVLGKKPDYARLQELGKEGIKLLIMNCLYAHEHKKCPSESVARELLKDTMLSVSGEGKAMIVTTFSSHLARLKSIIELGNKLNRKIVFLGRSLDKYVRAGEKIGLVKFTDQVEMLRHRDQLDKIFKKIEKEGKGKYLIVCTGHQGEPRSILSRMIKGDVDFSFEQGDVVIFSCQVIPVPVNIENRQKMEKSLRAGGVRIFRDVHVSGHGAREDHRELLEMIRPEHIIPIHAEPAKGKMIAELALQLGMKNTHVMEDGERLSLK
ncbi:ribonuclease J [Candidatus Woesearchaeota archaeon]|nr:ribonuclease J [Candidatus Woesearchaeota archaeon]MBI2582069.1 ribonuclease J [Candidatus Woesearchaeota archaeon]